MLKARQIKSVGYYTTLANKDDYYHKGKEPAGQWYGKGCEQFGLTGEVNKQDFYAICAGKNPKDLLQKLVMNAGKTGEKGRRPGWDLTFSAPKSVSTLWASADDRTKDLIAKLHDEAVKKALDYYAETYGATRTGKEGTAIDRTSKLFFALFEHSTSRALDPQLHTHAVMINLGINPHGQTKSLQTLELYRAEKEIGAFYRAELAHAMQRQLGVDVEQGEKGTFEVKGVERGLMKYWSKRRTEIEEAMEQAGLSGGRASEVIALKTRQVKEYPDREVLFTEWRAKAKEHGFNYQDALYRYNLQPKSAEQKAEFMKYAIEGYTAGTAYFTEQKLRQFVFEISPVLGLTTKEAQEMAKEWIEKEGVQLSARKDGQMLFTTKEIDRLEQKMIADVLSGQDYQPRLRERKVVIRADLAREQQDAVFYITETKGQFKIVSGMAGTGKTTMLEEARKVWEAQGYDVKGVSLAGVASKNLENEAGIKSTTIAKFLWDVASVEAQLAGKPKEKTAVEKIKEFLGLKEKEPELEVRQDSPEKRKARFLIDKNTVLVIDEAGMVATPQMVRIIEEAKRTGAKVVMVGDAKQLQPIEHGNPFYTFGQELGQAELKEIRRQKELWAKDAVYKMADGRAEEALKIFDEKGLLYIKDNRKEALQGLILQWEKDPNGFDKKLIVGALNEDVQSLNKMAQLQRQSRGELGKVGVEVNGYTVFENDRVVFAKAQNSLGLINGEGGIVRSVNIRRNELTVKLDNGEMRSVPLDRYKDVALGYAMTTNKAQGKTVENTYLFAGSNQMQSRELSYVQVSRARGQTHIFVTKEQMQEGALAKEMSRNQQKVLAHEWKEEIRAKRQREEKERERSVAGVMGKAIEKMEERGISI